MAGGHIWLDHAHFEQGLALAPPSGWLSLFTRGFAGTGFYRPLVALSFSVDARLGGSPAFLHVITLAWHSAAAFMVWLTASKLGLSRRAALTAAVLFAVHPLTSLVASANAFRSEAMVVVCLLGLVVAHLARRAWWAGAALLAGALVKETAWVLGPLFVVALELFERGRLRAATASRRPLILSELAAFTVATALRLAYAPELRAAPLGLPLSEAVGSRLAALSKSTQAIFLPVDSSICDAFPVTGWTSPTALGGALVLALLAALAWRGGRVGLLCALSLLPSLQLVPIMRWWSPHYLYLPLAFIVMLVVGAVERWLPRALPLGAVLASAFAVLSVRDGLRYASDARLWSGEVARQPACREGQFYLAEVARARGELETAARRYELSAAPVPGILAYADETAALANLGAVRFAQSRFTSAEEAFRSALTSSRDPEELRGIVHNLGALALARGDAEEAARVLEAETRRYDAFPASMLLRAKALHALGREPEAEALLEKLKLAPSRPGGGSRDR